MNYAPDLTTAAIKMVMALGVVLLMVWGLYRLAKGRLSVHPGGGQDKLIQVMESQYVGVKKSITLVQIPGSILVLGVGTDSVNLLSQIDDPEAIRNITVSTEQRTVSFKEHLQRFTQPKTQKRNNLQNDNAVTPSCNP